MDYLKRVIDQLAWEVVQPDLTEYQGAPAALRDAQEDLACLVGEAEAADYVNGCLIFHDAIQGPG